MNLLKISILACLLELYACSKVYEWQRVWNSGSVTREFAQVHEDDRTVIHYSTETNNEDNTPAVILHDYKFRANKFGKGIAAIRPLVAEGNQVCFITTLPDYWWDAKQDFLSFHGKSLPAKTWKKPIVLQKALPSELDPLSVDSVKDFCNVDRDHIFFMKKEKSNTEYNKTLKIHTTMGLFNIGIPDIFTDTVFDGSGPIERILFEQASSSIVATL